MNNFCLNKLNKKFYDKSEYTHFIDKTLLFKFVKRGILDNFVNNMNSKSHTLKEEEQLILELYNT